MRDALAAATLLLCSTFFIAGLMLTAPVAPGQAVAAIFPPWLDKTEILGAVSTAGGRMLRHGGVDSVALVRLETPDDALAGKRRAVENASETLDILDEIKLGLLVGEVPSHKLEGLLERVQQEREGLDDPELEDLLDHIDLRARVELAKYGR